MMVINVGSLWLLNNHHYSHQNSLDLLQKSTAPGRWLVWRWLENILSAILSVVLLFLIDNLISLVCFSVIGY